MVRLSPVNNDETVAHRYMYVTDIHDMKNVKKSIGIIF